ncbi:uncharacterized protein LOC105031105 isoform X2 [Esox lucius]|nr:uncharacterized protein LOC105031105 isoform X2 [Esox lucius]
MFRGFLSFVKGFLLWPKKNVTAHYGQESGYDGFSADMHHLVWNEHYPEKTSVQPKSISSVRPIPRYDRELPGTVKMLLPKTCANLPVQVSDGTEDHLVVSGHVYTKGDVDDFSLPGTHLRPTEPGGVSTVMKNNYKSSGEPSSEMAGLAFMSAFEPETNPGKVAESFLIRPSFDDVMDLDRFPKESLKTTDGATRCKKRMLKWKLDTNVRDEDTFSQKSPCQRKKTSFYRRGIWKKHLKLFLQLLFIIALIQDCNGICVACHDEECADVQSIYGLNDILLYERCNRTSCSHTTCVVRFDTTPVIIVCPHYNEDAETLEVESNGVQLKNTSVVACPTVKTDTGEKGGSPVLPTNPSPTQYSLVLGISLGVIALLCCGIFFWCYRNK